MVTSIVLYHTFLVLSCGKFAKCSPQILCIIENVVHIAEKVPHAVDIIYKSQLQCYSILAILHKVCYNKNEYKCNLPGSAMGHSFFMHCQILWKGDSP